MITRALLIVGLIVCMAYLLIATQPSGGALAAPLARTDTPTPGPAQPTATPDPNQPTATPWVVIMVTATPHRQAPSWLIPDLDKKIKAKKGGLIHSARLGLNLAVEPNPIPPELDATIADFMAWLTTRQQYYYALPANRYAQMLSTHSIAPADGFGEYPDGWYNHPTDQQYSWADLLAIQFEPLQFAVTVDQYSGPEGAGFVACFSLYVDSILWGRCVNYGPEALRNTEWAPVVEAVP